VLVVDTNILAYAANERSDFHDVCARWLESRIQVVEAWFTTWPIVYEFLRVATHPRIFARPLSASQAWGFLESVFSSSSLSILTGTPRHSDVAAALIKDLPDLRGSIFHDAHTAVLMREHGIRTIVTHDTDFHRFPFLEVVDPVAGG
jgi:toxin-antitoxin system PIN domain toxin